MQDLFLKLSIELHVAGVVEVARLAIIVLADARIRRALRATVHAEALAQVRDCSAHEVVLAMEAALLCWRRLVTIITDLLIIITIVFSIVGGNRLGNGLEAVFLHVSHAYRTHITRI